MIAVVTYIVASIYLSCIVSITLYCISQFNLLLRFKKNKADLRYAMDGLKKDWPFVTIQLPIFNERNVIQRLISNIVKMEYPKDKIEFQVLDDSNDDTTLMAHRLVKELQAKGLSIEHIHRMDRTGYKAGALKHGLESARGEYIAIFDADFIPAPDFLMRTLPYFEDLNVGVVQTRWDHLNQTENMLTELQSFQLNVHFTIEQGGRCNAPYFLQFNGTGGVWRKKAIEDAGSWHTDTLTEDLDLSYRAQLKGWKIKYLENVTSPAELPMEIGGLKSQQHRWMKGGAETAKKLLPLVWASSISWTNKMQASIHLLSSSFYLIVFILGFTSVPLGIFMFYANADYAFLKYLAISLPFVFVTYYYANVMIAWPKDNMLKRVVKFLFIFPIFLCISLGLSFHNSMAVIQGWLGKKSSFIRTPKKGDEKFLRQYQIKSISAITLVEGLLFVYYSIGIAVALDNGNYAFLFFHVMLALGYGSIFLLSLSSIKNKI